MNESWENILHFAQKSGNIITTGDIEKMNIHRVRIKLFVDGGKLVREAQEIYSLSDEIPDNYRLLQLRSTKMIFSYGSALFFHGMSDRVPFVIDVTVPQGYNVSRISRDHEGIQFHYVDKDIWSIGIGNIVTPLGGIVQVYDTRKII